VHWCSNQRFHGYLGDVSPVEHEEAHYAQLTTTTTIGNQENRPPPNPGWFTPSGVQLSRIRFLLFSLLAVDGMGSLL